MMSWLFALTCIFLAFQSSAVGFIATASTKTDERLMDELREIKERDKLREIRQTDELREIKETLRGLRSSEER